MAEHVLEEFYEFLPGGVTIAPSENTGVFDVLLNGELIFSKKKVERHAEEREVEDLLVELLEG